MEYETRYELDKLDSELKELKKRMRELELNQSPEVDLSGYDSDL